MEIELKLHVPAEAVAAVRRAVATRMARTTRLQAVYADTDDGRLAASGLALRLRREGAIWVQALKGQGDGVLQRFEHEVALPARPASGLPDPALHAGCEAWPTLQAATSGRPLRARHRTDIRRTHRVVRVDGARIEVALDEGSLRAGRRSIPVCELEFELLEGSPQALLALAARWVHRFGLWLDVRTKSERAAALAQGLAAPAPTKALTPARIDLADNPGTRFAGAVLSALAQVLANGAAVASGTYQAEHLHQWRVGVRRLRTALRALAPWSGRESMAAELESAWREPFAALGSTRDADVVEALLREPLRRAGLPPWRPLETQRPQEPRLVLRDRSLSVLALMTLGLALEAAKRPGEGAGVARASQRLLDESLHKALRGSARFARWPVAEQHRLRRRLKRLRYATEFLLPTPPARPRDARRLARLREAGDALGRWNDLHVAGRMLDADPEGGPAVATALAWVEGQLGPALRDVEAALRRLRRERTRH